MTETTDERLIEIYKNYLEDEDDMDIYNPSNLNSKGKVTPSKNGIYIFSRRCS